MSGKLPVIIPQLIDDVEVNAINARELWENLEVKTRFNDWIVSRINDSMFVEGQDYITLTETLVNGGRKKDYIISLEMAKHLAMMEKTGRAFEVRQYFIEAEKNLKKVVAQQVATPKLPTTYLEALEELISREREVLVMKPKVEAYDDLMSKDGLMYPTDGARKLCANPNLFLEHLRGKGILYHNRKKQLRPSPKALEKGWFVIREVMNPKAKKEEHKVLEYTFMTMKGLVDLKSIADSAIELGIVKGIGK